MSETTKFKSGDVVCAKSGGMAMTVESESHGEVHICWFDGGELRRGTLPANTLMLLKRD